MRALKRYAATPDLEKSPVAEELARGFPWLRFEGALEDQYRQHTYGDNLRQLRFNLAVAFGLMMAFAGMDDLIVSQSDQHVLSGVRLVVLVPVMLAVIGVTFLPNAARWYPRAILLAAPIGLFAIVGTEITAAHAGTELMFSTLVLATIFVYYLVGLLFYGAVACNPSVDLPGRRDTIQTLAGVGDALWITGAVVGVAGLVLFFVLPDEVPATSDAPSPSVSASCGPTGCYGSLEVSF